jgi:hypothetical protein
VLTRIGKVLLVAYAVLAIVVLLMGLIGSLAAPH